jgi:hypothetical protein
MEFNRQPTLTNILNGLILHPQDSTEGGDDTGQRRALAQLAQPKLQTADPLGARQIP